MADTRQTQSFGVTQKLGTKMTIETAFIDRKILRTETNRRQIDPRIGDAAASVESF